MKPIVGANHRDIYLEITLPVDAKGEYAFDADGKPVAGKEPVTFSLPRYDCLTRPEFKELMASLEAIGEDLPVDERIYSEVNAVLKPFVDADVLELVENLRLFEVKQISERVREGNSMSVGELLASTSS